MFRGTGRVRIMVALLAVVLASLAIPAGASQARVRLAASASDLSRAKLIRHSDTSESIGIQVYLGLRDTAGARSLLASVSEPASPDYGSYVSPETFRSRFSRSDADAASVASWLRDQGFTVGNTPANNLYVPATGTVAQAESAFDVTLNQYEVDGVTKRAPASAPSVPASLGDIVKGVNGLSDETVQSATTPPPAPAYITGRPCSAYWAENMATSKPKAYGKFQPVAVCGYSAAQMQGAYGVADAIGTGTDGSGVTVAVVDAFASPTIQQDLNEYSTRNGLPSTSITQYTAPPFTASLAQQQGWWVEQTIDLEAVHAMAPGASLVYWGATSSKDADLDAALTDIIDNNRAQIITNSYASRSEQVPASLVQMENDLFVQAGDQGIGMYFASGDEGDNKAILGYKSVEWSGSSPFVTAVGGTSLGVDAGNNYSFETGWGTDISSLSKDHKSWKPAPPGSFLYGSTGGTSRITAQPGYQAGVVPASLSGQWGGNNRVVPDISMDGDPNTGFTIVESYTFPGGSTGFGESRYGGTSLSSPLFAGMMALADDAAGSPHGFANPVLYALDGTSAVHDIVNPSETIAVVRSDFVNSVDPSHGRSFSLRTMNMDSSLQTKPGYDNVTGLGTPNGQAFLDALR